MKKKGYAVGDLLPLALTFVVVAVANHFRAMSASVRQFSRMFETLTASQTTAKHTMQPSRDSTVWKPSATGYRHSHSTSKAVLGGVNCSGGSHHRSLGVCNI